MLQVVEVSLQLSLRSPVGRPFTPRQENGLFQDLTNLAAESRRANNASITLVPEFVGPYGVPDLVAIVHTRELLEKRIGSDIPPLLNPTDAAIVSALGAQRSRSFQHLIQVPELSDESMVDRRLAHLLKIGAIETSGNGFVRNSALNPIGRVHAFEAKVRDWRSGIDQARTYGLWADSVTLVMGKLPEDASSVCREAKRWLLGLGLKSEWRCRPRLRNHTRARRLWASEHAVDALRGG